MGLTLQDALSKIGTAGYTGVDGLRRLVNETSAIPVKEQSGTDHGFLDGIAIIIHRPQGRCSFLH